MEVQTIDAPTRHLRSAIDFPLVGQADRNMLLAASVPRFPTPLLRRTAGLLRRNETGWRNPSPKVRRRATRDEIRRAWIELRRQHIRNRRSWPATAVETHNGDNIRPFTRRGMQLLAVCSASPVAMPTLFRIIARGVVGLRFAMLTGRWMIGLLAVDLFAPVLGRSTGRASWYCRPDVRQKSCALKPRGKPWLSLHPPSRRSS